MKITKVEEFSQEDLIEKLRNVSMLTQPDVKPYNKTEISIVDMLPENVIPAQLYVLKENVQRIITMDEQLKKFGQSIFDIDGYLKLWIEGSEEPINLLPPIVELSRERNGRGVDLLNDGMHRLYAARIVHAYCKCVYIKGVDSRHPYYAHPIPGNNPWDKVELIDELKEGFVKKWHRISDSKSLYRNFNSAFDNVGAPRMATC